LTFSVFGAIIGRLMYDTKSIFEDQLEAIERSSELGITYKEDRISASKRLAELVEAGIYPKSLF